MACAWYKWLYRSILFLSVVPITLVALKLKVELSLLHLCFLQAEEVGIEFLKLVLEVLAYASAQAIYVPGYKLHFGNVEC